MDDNNFDVNDIINNYKDMININSENDSNQNSAEKLLFILNNFINNFEQFKSYDDNFKNIFNTYLPTVTSIAKNLLNNIVTNYSENNCNIIVEKIINLICELQTVNDSNSCIDVIVKILNSFSSVDTINVFIKNEKARKK